MFVKQEGMFVKQEAHVYETRGHVYETRGYVCETRGYVCEISHLYLMRVCIFCIEKSFLLMWRPRQYLA